jgi:imidazolonepropionase-like amidohydrolase
VIVRSIVLVAACGLAASLNAQAQPSAVTVFQNVRIFDGKGSRLSGPSHVLVRGNRIERISATPIPTDRRADTVLIDDGGRTLMPGLIDVHWHAMLVRPTPAAALAAEVGYSNLVAAAEATDTLMRGFTTVRDLGGPAFGLKRAIDEGIVAGPRISEALVMATGTNAQLLAMSGKRNPYPGKLGVVEEGALADLILVNGNPIEDIKLVADPGKNFVLIMKDGKIYKNTLGMR